jgi:putative nucleotidyltransferase with HDIG domain
MCLKSHKTKQFDKLKIYNSINQMRDIVIKSLEDPEVNKLPSLPHILIKLLRACREDEVCFDTVSDIISKDAALSTKVISVANSPVYGHARHLDSLKQILMFLGLDTIKSIAITASVKQFFSRYSSEKSLFLKDFWKHALSCATIAQELAKLTNYKYIEEAYIAGLLHDIGKLVLENKAEFEYGKLAHGKNKSEELLQLEKENFNITHDDLGAMLLDKWGINESINDAVRYHHASIDDIQDAHLLVKIINLSNILASNLNEQQSALKFESAGRLFDLSESTINKVIQNAESKVREVARSMDIDIGNTNPADDEKKQVMLAQEVRDIALIRGSQLPRQAEDESSVYISIQKSLMILFGIQTSLFFTYDKNSKQLFTNNSIPEESSSLANDLKIDLKSKSILSKALLEKTITNSFSISDSETLTVVDQQLIRSLKTDGIVCIPIGNTNSYMAVIVIGLENKKYEELICNTNLLNIFASDTTVILEKCYQQSTIANKAIDETKLIFNNKAHEIIHEANNPLSIIRNYLHVLGNRLNNEDPAQSDIKIIKEEIDRVGSIILRCTNDYEKESTIKNIKALDINKVISDVINIFESSLFITHSIKNTLKLNKNIDMVHAEKDTIKQIITNLIKNSVEAIEDHGEITITSRNINVNGKPYVEIEIKDNGPGIPRDILDNLYHPVKTKKEKGHSGLGLSIIKNLIDGSNGYISCRTADTGAVFNIQLPKYK